MRKKLQRKVTEEKPSYSREEIQWLLEHLGDPSPEIRDELVFTSLMKGYTKRLIVEEFQLLNVLLGRLFMPIFCMQMVTSTLFSIKA